MEKLTQIKSHLGRGSESRELFELEREIGDKIREAARVWQSHVENKQGRTISYWEDAIPSEVSTICERFGLVACTKMFTRRDT